MHLTVKEICSKYNITRPTLSNLIKKGLPAYRLTDTKRGRLRFDSLEVEAWYNENVKIKEG